MPCHSRLGIPVFILTRLASSPSERARERERGGGREAEMERFARNRRERWNHGRDWLERRGSLRQRKQESKSSPEGRKGTRALGPPFLPPVFLSCPRRAAAFVRKLDGWPELSRLQRKSREFSLPRLPISNLPNHRGKLVLPLSPPPLSLSRDKVRFRDGRASSSHPRGVVFTL